MRDSGCEIRDARFGIRDWGYVIRDARFGIRDSGYEINAGIFTHPESRIPNPGSLFRYAVILHKIRLVQFFGNPKGGVYQAHVAVTLGEVSPLRAIDVDVLTEQAEMIAETKNFVKYFHSVI